MGLHTSRHTRKNSGFSTQDEHLVLLGLEALTAAPNLRYATRSSYKLWVTENIGDLGKSRDAIMLKHGILTDIPDIEGRDFYPDSGEVGKDVIGGGRNPWLRGLSFGHDSMRGRYIVEATAGNSSPRSYQPITKRRCARESLTPSPLLPSCLTDRFFPSLGLDGTPNFSRRRLYTSPWVVPAVLRPARKCAPRRPPAH